MIEKSDNGSHPNASFHVLILTGLLGLSLGLSNSTWQHAVETGQVLAGIVKYPTDNPFYLYHLKAFSIINHLSALLLVAIKSEKVVSIIVSALLGIIAFQAIGLFIYAINKNVLLAVFGALLVYFANYVGNGVIYPIVLLGEGATFGILGLSFVVLILALIAAEAYRPALFCLGLAPCVHVAWAAWLFLILLLSAMFHWDFAKKIIKTHYVYFIAGAFITVAILIYQMYLIRNLPVIDSSTKKQYLASFAQYWDSHREKFYWDSASPKAHLMAKRGILFCIYSIMAGFFCLKYFTKSSPLSFLFTAVVISGILSLLLGALTQLPQEKIPSFLLVLMPGRCVNLNNVILAASLLGILTCYDNRPYITNYNIFIFFLLCSFFARHGEVQIISFAVILLWFLYLIYASSNSAGTSFLRTRDHKVGYEKLLLIFMVVFLVINLFNSRFIRHYLINSRDFEDKTNKELYQKVSQGNGLLASTFDSPMIQLKTRRPILADMSSPNFFTYAADGAVVYNNILQKVYGIDLLTPPPKEFRHKEIPSVLYKDLWQKRTLQQWQQIRKEFNVTDVLTPYNWKLSLPVVAKTDKMSLYTIPAETCGVFYQNN